MFVIFLVIFVNTLVLFCGIKDDYPYVGKHYKSDNDVTLLSLSCLWRNWENKISPVMEVNKFPYSLRHLPSMSFSNFGLTGKKQRPNLVGDFWAGSWINRYLERQSPVSKRAFWWRSLLQTIFNFWQKWNANDRMSLHLAWGKLLADAEIFFCVLHSEAWRSFSCY